MFWILEADAKIYLVFMVFFFFGCVESLLLRAGFSLVAASWGYSSLRCSGFSLQWLLLLQSMGSRRAGFSSCGTRALECRLSSCGAWAQLFHGTWDFPGAGLEPVFLALAGGFLTSAPPGDHVLIKLQGNKISVLFFLWLVDGTCSLCVCFPISLSSSHLPLYLCLLCPKKIPHIFLCLGEK